MRFRRSTRVGAALLAAFGPFVRLCVLDRNPLSFDQAVVGLMAHEIPRGHFFAFYWGQHCDGGEPYLVAAVFALFGQSHVSQRWQGSMRPRARTPGCLKKR